MLCSNCGENLLDTANFRFFGSINGDLSDLPSAGIYLLEIVKDSVDVGSDIKEAFEEFGFTEARLKDFDIFIEANNGYGSVTVYEIDLFFSPGISSAYVLVQSGTYGIIGFLVVLVITSILGKRF